MSNNSITSNRTGKALANQSNARDKWKHKKLNDQYTLALPLPKWVSRRDLTDKLKNEALLAGKSPEEIDDIVFKSKWLAYGPEEFLKENQLAHVFSKTGKKTKVMVEKILETVNIGKLDFHYCLVYTVPTEEKKEASTASTKGAEVTEKETNKSNRVNPETKEVELKATTGFFTLRITDKAVTASAEGLDTSMMTKICKVLKDNQFKYSFGIWNKKCVDACFLGVWNKLPGTKVVYL